MSDTEIRRRFPRIPDPRATARLAFAFAATASLANNYLPAMSHVRTLIILLIAAGVAPSLGYRRPPSWLLGVLVGLLRTDVYGDLGLALIVAACFVADQFLFDLIEFSRRPGTAASGEI